MNQVNVLRRNVMLSPGISQRISTWIYIKKIHSNKMTVIKMHTTQKDRKTITFEGVDTGLQWVYHVHAIIRMLYNFFRYMFKN